MAIYIPNRRYWTTEDTEVGHGESPGVSSVGNPIGMVFFTAKL